MGGGSKFGNLERTYFLNAPKADNFGFLHQVCPVENRKIEVNISIEFCIFELV